jgi:hypothetical protein
MEKINRVIDVCKEYLSLARIIRFRLYVAAQSRFVVIPLMPVPQLARFGTIREIDLFEAYRAVGRAGEQLALVHGGQLMRPVTEKIRLCFWTT